MIENATDDLLHVRATQILQLRKAIADSLAETLQPANVEEFPFAEFTPADIERAMRGRSLAVRVAFAGSPADTKASDGGSHAPLAWAIYVISKDIAGVNVDRSTIALRVVAALLRVIHHACWDVDFTVMRPERVRAAQLFRGENDARSAMVWGVSWMQSAALDYDAPCDLRDFLTLVTRYDIAPADGVIDAEDTIQMRDEDG